MTDKPQLKPIGAVAGIGGYTQIRQYLTQQLTK